MSTPWLLRAQVARRPGALRLICIPFAGGSSTAYRPWAELLPPEVELLMAELPGRGTRFGEPLARRPPEVVEALAEAVAAEVAPPYALFGHSMGGLLAYELTLALERRPFAAPRALFVSARPAPPVRSRAPRLAGLDDASLCAALEQMGGTPPEVLAHAELKALVLPVIRGDFALCEAYAPRAGEPVSCPIRVYGGEADAYVSPEELEPWSQCAGAGFSMRIFPGGHFFLQPHRRELVEDVLATLGVRRPVRAH